MPRRRQILSLSISLALLICAAIAWFLVDRAFNHSSSRRLAATDLITRTYDVRALLTEIPSFASPDSNRPATTPSIPRETRLAQLKTSLRSQVDPPSWRSPDVTLSEQNGNLTIRQTVANQARLRAILENAVARRAEQVTVETRFVYCDAVDKLLAELGDHWIPDARSHTDYWPHLLTDAQRNTLLNAVQRDKNGTIVTAPRLTLFNGQRAYVKVARETAYVKELKAIADRTGGQPTINPTIATVTSGMTIDCLGQISADHASITLALNPKSSSLLDLVASPWSSPAGAPPATGTIQIPYVRHYDLDSTITLPDRGTALFRLHPTFTPQKRPQDDDSPVLFFVRATIVHPSPTPITTAITTGMVAPR